MRGRPQPEEFASRFSLYVNLVPDGDIVEVLRDLMDSSTAFYATISEQQSLLRYAPGKWTIREVLGHVTDTERIFCYRALCFARGDQTALPGFEQDDYVAATNFTARSFFGLRDEFRQVRKSTAAFFDGLTGDELLRRGIASSHGFSVRALAHLIAGHEIHHRQVIRDRYLSR